MDAGNSGGDGQRVPQPEAEVEPRGRNAFIRSRQSCLVRFLWQTSQGLVLPGIA